MSYTFRLYDSICKVPADAWMALRRDPADLYMHPEFITTVEETMGKMATFWHLLVYDDEGRPAGSASLCLHALDAALLCPPRPRRALQIVRRVWPRCLLFHVLFCGLPFSAGQSHLRLAASTDAKQVFRQFDAALSQLAAEARAAAIVCKEFCDGDLAQTDQLCSLGYVRGPSLPMNCFTPRYRDFNEFCASLRSHYRYKIRRSQRKFVSAGFRVSHFCGQDALPHYTDEVHQLYLDVHDRAEVQLEVLPAEFFRQLAVRCADAVRLTAVFQGPRVVAFAWGLRLGHSYQNVFVGFDYALNDEYDLYFNLMASDLDQAIQLQVHEIQMGQTADVFKSRLGCHHQPRYVYAKGTRWFTAKPLHLFHGLLMPPPAPPPVRDLFRDASTLASEEPVQSVAERRC
jgi:predicted N-acyltransferase